MKPPETLKISCFLFSSKNKISVPETRHLRIFWPSRRHVAILRLEAGHQVKTQYLKDLEKYR